ncbi:MAG TPA: acyl-CoA desaturase [Bacteroidales bacterium]|nr:acyl-CoA desaturase [Bacteroidales bacterium]HRZ49308.1 acyl-CoA desaturase [Bacteroidales bacterium]
MDYRITFNQHLDAEFTHALKGRADAYFRDNGISRYGNRIMHLKSAAMLAMYILPFVGIVAGGFPVWLCMVMYAIMGVGLAGIGMSVMHDANHYAYSDNPEVNRIMGMMIFILGADAYNWKIKHNKLHHVYTNIYGSDEDINSRAILRFAYAAPLRRYHRYQHIYGWFLYALMSISMVVGDVRKRKEYRERGVTNISQHIFDRSMRWLILSKILYFGIIFGFPLLFSPLTWYQVVLGFLLMHLVSGVIMSLIFQMAHVVDGPEQTLPDAERHVERSMVLHQLRSAADFSKSNRLITWYVGGLNYQVEHHLFPRVCHVHYPALSAIVEATTREFGMPYYVYNTFGEAFRSHYRTLKRLGREKIRNSF